MADPSGQTVILLRKYEITRSDLLAEAKSCVEYARAKNLPDYVGPLVVEQHCQYDDLWLTRPGKRFWEYCVPGAHAVLYSLSALDRRPQERRDSLDRILSIGTRVHVLTPVVTEITRQVRDGMTLEADRIKKEKFTTKDGGEWGLCRSKITRHGKTYNVPLERRYEAMIANQVIGRSVLGEAPTDILNWLQKWSVDNCPTVERGAGRLARQRYFTRWVGKWTHERVVKMLRDFAGPDSEAYKYWTRKESK